MAHTQRITARDIRTGQVRIPTDAKNLFPLTLSRVEIDFLGHVRECRWDPRFGPDQERSGVIGVGRELMKLTRTDETLSIEPSQDAAVRLFR